MSQSTWMCESDEPRIDKRKKLAIASFFDLVGRQGFEPWLAESESAVLPLDDLPRIGNDSRILTPRAKD